MMMGHGYETHCSTVNTIAACGFVRQTIVSFLYCNVQVTWHVFPILLPSASRVAGSACKGQNVVANSRFLLFPFIIVVSSTSSNIANDFDLFFLNPYWLSYSTFLSSGKFINLL